MSWLFKSLQSKDEVNEDVFLAGDVIHSQSGDENSQPSNSSSSTLIVGIRNDLAELGGSLKTGLSFLSNNNKAVFNEFSKFTSNFFNFRYDNIEEAAASDDVSVNHVAGITQGTVKFVEEISTRTEFWTEFPLQLPNDFRMSDVQKQHASTIERLVPRLTQLRAQLRSYMVDEQFWMLYFIFLLPRLDQHDYEILSTPQIVETRGLLLRKLQNKREEQSSDSTEVNISGEDEDVGGAQQETFTSCKKEVSQITNATKGLDIHDEEDLKRCLDERYIDTCTLSLDKQKRPQEDEVVSFSDLEDSDNDLSAKLSASRQRQGFRYPSPSGSSDWVQLNESAETHGGSRWAQHSTSDGESIDWLKVDESD